MISNIKIRSTSLLALGLLLAVLCFGCSKDSGAETAEIKNLPSNPATTPHGPSGGGSIGGSPAVMVPQQTRPDSK